MALSDQYRNLFGDIAVSKGLLTWAQVRDALKRQTEYKLKGIPMHIGEICVEMGLLTQAQYNDILATQHERDNTISPEDRNATNYANLEEIEDGETFQLGRYRLEKRLGGVMSIVFKGTDTQTHSTVALKILPRHLAHDSAFVERFKREIKATCMMAHPNIVRICDTGIEQGVFYLATEFIDGETLSQRLRRDGKIPRAEALRIGRDIAHALGHAHARNVLHRDVKPENVMISSTGDVKLADLGLAKFLHDEQFITAEGIAVGTPHYISPEQARALKDVDHRSDLYSLGAMLFHIITGRLPYEGDNGAEVMKRHVFEAVPDPRSIDPNLSADIAEMIMKLMAKNPAQRFQTGEELAQHLDKLLKTMLSANLLITPRHQIGLRKPFI
ncbi:MAG: serine/threonine-protein kinase [Planctomycetota bacterium]